MKKAAVTLVVALVAMTVGVFAMASPAKEVKVVTFCVAPMERIIEYAAGEFKGYLPEFLELVRERLESQIREPVEFQFLRSSLHRALEDVKNGKCDTTAGGITPLYERRQKGFEFSAEWYITGLRMLAFQGPRTHFHHVIAGVGSSYIFWEGFGWFVGVLIVLSVIIFLFERRHNANRFNKPWRDIPKIAKYLLGFSLPAYTHGLETPKAIINSWLTLVYMVYGGVTLAILAGAVLSIMDDPRGPAHDATQYFMNGKVVIVKEGSYADVMVEELASPREVIRVPEMDRAYRMLIAQRRDDMVVLHDAPEIDAVAEQIDGLEAIGGMFVPQTYEFPFWPGNFWKRPFDLAISDLLQHNKPTLRHLERKWFGANTQ